MAKTKTVGDSVNFKETLTDADRRSDKFDRR